MFAFTDKVIGNLQIATFAAFGTFATLVLASFAGTRRDKLVAHTGLALTGSVLVTIGTVVHSPTALAALATVPVTFAVFFGGVLGPNAASGATAALLAYVLPAASPGTISMIPDRLAGWWLASVVGTAAVLAMSPRTGDDPLRGAASTLAESLADELDASLLGADTEDQQTAALKGRRELITRFNGAPFRPTGLAAPDQAFAHAVELLEWCSSLVADTLNERADLRDAAPEDRALFTQASSVLRSVAGLFSGGRARPDIDALKRAREESLARVRGLTPDGAGFREAAGISFHANSIAVAAVALADEALVATRLETPAWLASERRRTFLRSATATRTARRVSRVASAAWARASLRSVWLINSLRGSVALAASVAVADLVSVQHGFWVVLGTLSVLRTNAASTGSTALRALIGTGIGFVIGGALLLAIGTDQTALWVALPIAVLVAAYAPGTAPFAVGQAAFTVTVAVLFNLLVPVGWKVGVVRVEDVALGVAVSVLAGTLLWPRGVSALVGDDLADVFRWGASYLSQAVDWAIGARASEPDAAVPAGTAAERLEDALRGLMAEQGTKHLARYELWRLVGGSLALRLTAWSVADLPSDSEIGSAGPILTRRTNTLAGWYERLAELVGRPNGSQIESLAPPAFAPGDTVDSGSASPYAIWLCEHLKHLSDRSAALVEPATRIAEIRRTPWWR
ncbi:MAG TPA: FUSC family protein [Solirubrobacteraceae bacterium]|nr:FUSC family protein [Solirubrobacteraceae bacterium]